MMERKKLGHQIVDFIIFRLTSEDIFGIPNLKLQKLLYYIQAWHLAFNDKPLFEGKFQSTLKPLKKCWNINL